METPSAAQSMYAMPDQGSTVIVHSVPLATGNSFAPKGENAWRDEFRQTEDSFLRRGRGCSAGAFLKRVNSVHGEFLESLCEAAGPSDFDGVEFGDGAEAEVDAHIATGIVAGATANFVDEDARASFYGDPGADGVAVRAEFLRRCGVGGTNEV